MNILCVGGGPAGLYVGLLMTLRKPSHRVVVERNRPFDTFGWGVVLSDQTLGKLCQANPLTGHRIAEALNHWDDIAVFFVGRADPRAIARPNLADAMRTEDL